jgi:hypothetical protein
MRLLKFAKRSCTHDVNRFEHTCMLDESSIQMMSHLYRCHLYISTPDQIVARFFDKVSDHDQDIGQNDVQLNQVCTIESGVKIDRDSFHRWGLQTLWPRIVIKIVKHVFTRHLRFEKSDSFQTVQKLSPRKVTSWLHTVSQIVPHQLLVLIVTQFPNCQTISSVVSVSHTEQPLWS